MKKAAAALFIAALIVALGCVRIPKTFEAHITIDIRQHIEQQAGSTLDFIEGKSDTLPSTGSDAKPKGTSWLRDFGRSLSPIAVAHAAQLKTNSPEIVRLAKEMRARNEQIAQIKADGVVGENNRGYLDIRDASKIAEAEKKNELQRLVAAENKDRKLLYTEIAHLNESDNVSITTVEQVYALERIKRAKAGEWVQLPAAGADLEAFRASEAGKRLGADYQPDAWVKLK